MRKQTPFSISPKVKENAVYVLLFIFLIVGITVCNDYGLGWDEKIHREYGLLNFDYVFHHDLSIYTKGMSGYGVFFEWLCIGFEKTGIVSDIRDVMISRHMINHLLFLLSGFFMYKLVLRVWKNEWLGIVALLIYLLNPRIYAHSFFNPKDIPFLSMMVISIYFSIKTLYSNKYKDYIMLGVIYALTINIRIMGLMLPFFFTIFRITDFLFNIKKESLKKTAFQFLLLLTVTFIVLYITWPILWHDPFGKLASSFSTMSSFWWRGSVLFMGNFYISNELPWYHIIWWMIITIPLVYWFLAVIGVIFLVIKLFRKGWRVLNDKNFMIPLFFFLCFISPLAIVITMKSVVYDDWRQVFFVYGGLVLISAYGVYELWQRIRGKLGILLIAALVVTFCFIVAQMIRLHPYEGVYFNDVVYKLKNKREGLRKNYELDYWGTSFKDAYEYILKTDDRKHVVIYYNIPPGLFALDILRPEDRERITFLQKGSDNPDYFVSNYRVHPEDYTFQGNFNIKEVFNIKAYNSRIISVWKITTNPANG